MKYLSSLNTYLLSLKNVISFLLLMAITLGSFALLNNTLQNGIAFPSEDDIHTINYGINSLYSYQVSEARVGESTRWLARLTYPLGLYYMNSNMGGEHYITGWEYSGGYYVRKHFHNQSDIIGDPNLQDLEFAMKFVLGSIVILTFFLASYMISKQYGHIAALAYYSLSMGTSLINTMLSVFYTESTLVILINLMIVIAFIPKIGALRLHVWLAFILAFAVSAKITGAVFLIPILMILKDKQGDMWVKGLRMEGFVLLVIAFVFLIHVFVVDYMTALDQTLANVYHYKTGHLETEPSGMYQFQQIMKQIPVWLYLFPVGLALIFFSRVAAKGVVLAMGLTAFIIIVASLGTSVFVVRNLTTPVVLIIFVLSIALSYLVNLAKFESIKLITVTALVLLFAGAWVRLYQPVNEKSVSAFEKTYKTIGLIDVSKKYFPNATVLNGMPDRFTLQGHVSEFIEPLLPYECIIIRRINNNKHLTNYLLPMNFSLVARRGNYFVFEQKKPAVEDVKNIDEHITNIKNLTNFKPVYDDQFRIYRINDKLVLYKSNCTAEMLSNRFFLHIYPTNAADLPGESAQYGYTNSDFTFPETALYKGEAYLSIPLPPFPIEHIEVGQFNDEGRLWQTTIKF